MTEPTKLEGIRKENRDPWLSVHAARSNTNYLLERVTVLEGKITKLEKALREIYSNTFCSDACGNIAEKALQAAREGGENG